MFVWTFTVLANSNAATDKTFPSIQVPCSVLRLRHQWQLNPKLPRPVLHSTPENHRPLQKLLFMVFGEHFGDPPRTHLAIMQMFGENLVSCTLTHFRDLFAQLENCHTLIFKHFLLHFFNCFGQNWRPNRTQFIMDICKSIHEIFDPLSHIFGVHTLSPIDFA